MSATAQRDPFGLVGSTIEGKYRVDEVVGEGGFGVVYKGAHLPFDALPIAVKCLKIPAEYTREGRAAFVDNFRREGALLCKLGSEPGIVRVHAYGVTATPSGAQVPFLILEWLEGKPLEVILAEHGPFAEREALEAIRLVADAIAAAHAEGIAHRDLKPANVMQVPTRKGPAWKVLDFGIAKAMQEGESVTRLKSQTSSGTSAFSPGYGAPEQFSRKAYGPTGPWTDVHALGLMLVELLTGRAALDGEELGPLYMSATATVRPTPRARGAQVSDACETLCAKALALMPKDRFADAGVLVKKIETILGTPVPSHAPLSPHATAKTEPAAPRALPAVVPTEPWYRAREQADPATEPMPAASMVQKKRTRGADPATSTAVTHGAIWRAARWRLVRLVGFWVAILFVTVWGSYAYPDMWPVNFAAWVFASVIALIIEARGWRLVGSRWIRISIGIAIVLASVGFTATSGWMASVIFETISESALPGFAAGAVLFVTGALFQARDAAKASRSPEP